MLRRLTRLLAVIAVATRLKVNADDEALTPDEREALGDALREDGSLDTARLITNGRTVDMDTLRREVAGERASVAAQHSVQS